MSLMARIKQGKAQEVPQGTFHATATTSAGMRTVPIWVERNVSKSGPIVASKELSHG